MFEQNVHDELPKILRLYSVIESVAFYNHLEMHRSKGLEHRWGDEECVCCGQSPRYGCSILCVDCNEIWDKAERKDGNARNMIYERVEEWLEQSDGKQQYSFGRFLSVCSAEIDRIFPERKNKDINKFNKLIRCLKEIEKKKLTEFDSREIDNLIQSVSQRWNILEVS